MRGCDSRVRAADSQIAPRDSKFGKSDSETADGVAPITAFVACKPAEGLARSYARYWETLAGDPYPADLSGFNKRGRLIRSLVGLDRAAVASANQLEFVEMVIEHLTEKCMMNPQALYQSLFTDVASSGPDQMFSIKRTDELIDVINRINSSAGEQVA